MFRKKMTVLIAGIISGTILGILHIMDIGEQTIFKISLRTHTIKQNWQLKVNEVIEQTKSNVDINAIQDQKELKAIIER
jgi:hypothetical protein